MKLINYIHPALLESIISPKKALTRSLKKKNKLPSTFNLGEEKPDNFITRKRSHYFFKGKNTAYRYKIKNKAYHK